MLNKDIKINLNKIEEIIELLFNKYDAPKEQIKKDTEEFINDLISKGIVENG